MGLQSLIHPSRLLTEFVQVVYRNAQPGRTTHQCKSTRMLLSTSDNTTRMNDLIVPASRERERFRSSSMTDLKYHST